MRLKIQLPRGSYPVTIQLQADHEHIFSSDFFYVKCSFNTENQFKRINYDYKRNQAALFYSKILSFDKHGPWFEQWDKNILKTDLWEPK